MALVNKIGDMAEWEKSNMRGRYSNGDIGRNEHP